MTERKKNLFMLTAAVVIFGTIGVVRSFIPLPSGFIAFVRGILGGGFLLLFMAAKRQKPDMSAIRKNLLVLCISGGLIGINWVCLFEAFRYTAVSTATLCYYMAPVFTMILARAVLKEKLGLRKTLCAAAALVGMAMVSGIFSGADFSPLGLGLALSAALMYAVVILLNKLLRNISALDRAVVQLFCAAAAVLPYTLLAEDVSLSALTPFSAIMLVYAGAVNTGLAYALYFGSIGRLPAQTAAIFGYIDPAVAVALSMAVLGERLTEVALIGAVVVIGAAICSEISPKPKAE